MLAPGRASPVKLPSTLLFLVLFVGLIPLPANAKKTFVTIGTGGVTGVYYPAGGAICQLVNRGRRAHGIRCTVESTPGSIHNLNALRAGDLDLAVVQSDWQFHAYNGTSKFTGQGPDERLRALFSLHTEPFTVVARADSGIERLTDLKGKRVNIGNPGSGQRATMEVLMKALGWTKTDFAATTELKSAEQAQALCDGGVDAIVFAVGHPSGSIKEATTSCQSVLVAVTGPVIDQLVGKHSYYRKATIPGAMYRGNSEDVATFGVGATVVTSESTQKTVVYQIVKSIFSNLGQLRRMHPAFAHFDQTKMVREGLSAPLHRGARQYYEEVDLR